MPYTTWAIPLRLVPPGFWRIMRREGVAENILSDIKDFLPSVRSSIRPYCWQAPFLSFFETVPRLFHPEKVNSQGMLALAIVGVLMNGAAVLRLKKNKHSVNQKTVMLHLMEDALGWIAVLIGAIVIYFTGWTIIDPLLSLCIAVYIFINAFKNMKTVLTIFLQATPEDVDIDKVKESLLELVEVEELHDTHVWTMDGEYNILSVHLVLKENKALSELAEIRDKVNHVLKQHHIQHITVQFEVRGEVCALEKH